MTSARYFAGRAAEIEHTRPPTTEVLCPAEYISYWSGAIVLAVMSLEAYAFELLNFPDRFESLPEAPAFEDGENRSEVVERYSLVFEKVTGQKLDTGRGEGQAVQVLVKLRNELVHSKTEWRDLAEVSEALRSACRNRFDLNPYLAGENFFPDQCISASSAAWAVRTAEDFLSYFCKSTGCRSSV